MTRWPGKRVLAAPLIFGLVAAACGGSATPATSVAPSSDTPSPAVSGSRAPSPDAGDPIAVGPVAIQAEAIDPGGDVRLALAVLDRADRGRVRSQAGFARESGTGWEALATSIDLAVDAAVGVIAADLGISVPTAGLDRDFSFWRRLVAGDVSADPRLVGARWLRRLDDLAALESDWAESASGQTAVHFDMRDDNLLMTDDGGVLVCDWNWLALAAPWVDLVGLLVSVHGDGLDAELMLAITH